MPQAIRFYRVNEPYGVFSNFAPYPITIDGTVWPTSEHWFQAQKFVGTALERELMDAIRTAPSPMQAALIGRDRTKPRRADWGAVRDGLMREAVRAKFSQHEELQEILLSTGEAQIVEHTASDAYWGDGGDGGGANMLGRILMEIRSELRGSP